MSAAIRSMTATAFAVCLFASGAMGQTAVQWPEATGGNGHWYQLVVSSPMTWPNARAACESRGGYLITSRSAAEEAFLLSIANRAAHPTAWVNDFGGNAAGPWLGGFQPADANPTQPWAWVSGESWQWAGWAPGERGAFSPGNGISLMLGWAGSNVYRGWADAGLTDFPPYPLSPSYVIEWSADCNSDGIVDYGQILDGTFEDANLNGVPDCCEGGPMCGACDGDVTGNGAIDGVDLAAVLGDWGSKGNGEFATDITNDGTVDASDLTIVLNGWGPCPK